MGKKTDDCTTKRKENLVKKKFVHPRASEKTQSWQTTFLRRTVYYGSAALYDEFKGSFDQYSLHFRHFTVRDNHPRLSCPEVDFNCYPLPTPRDAPASYIAYAVPVGRYII